MGSQRDYCYHALCPTPSRRPGSRRAHTARRPAGRARRRAGRAAKQGRPSQISRQRRPSIEGGSNSIESASGEGSASSVDRIGGGSASRTERGGPHTASRQGQGKVYQTGVASAHAREVRQEGCLEYPLTGVLQADLCQGGGGGLTPMPVMWRHLNRGAALAGYAVPIWKISSRRIRSGSCLGDQFSEGRQARPGWSPAGGQGVGGNRRDPWHPGRTGLHQPAAA